MRGHASLRHHHLRLLRNAHRLGDRHRRRVPHAPRDGWRDAHATSVSARVRARSSTASRRAATVPIATSCARPPSRVAHALGWPLADERAAFLADSLPSWQPFPDTNAALERLAPPACRLGILSNIDDDLLAATRKHFTVDFDLDRHRAAGAVVQAGPRALSRGARAHRRRALAARRPEQLPRHRPCNTLGIPTAWINRRGDAGSPAARRSTRFAT